MSLGLFIQTTSISAQDMQLDTELSVEDPILAAEEGIPMVMRDTPERSETTGTTTWVIIRMILVLVLVAAAIYGVVFLFRKATKQAPSANPFLKVLASAQLAANRYAHIVSVGSKAWLVGSSDGGVNLISELEDKEIVDAMLLEDSRKSAQAPGRFPDFSSLLRRMGLNAEGKAPGADDIRKRRERLKGL